MTNQAPTSVIPLGVTIALFIASIILSIAGYGFRLLAGEELGVVLSHAMKVVPFFVFGLPAFVWLGSLLTNKMGKTNVHPRNAWTLGWLLSTVAMLSIMGVYS